MPAGCVAGMWRKPARGQIHQAVGHLPSMDDDQRLIGRHMLPVPEPRVMRACSGPRRWRALRIAPGERLSRAYLQARLGDDIAAIDAALVQIALQWRLNARSFHGDAVASAYVMGYGTPQSPKLGTHQPRHMRLLHALRIMPLAGNASYSLEPKARCQEQTRVDVDREHHNDPSRTQCRQQARESERL